MDVLLTPGITLLGSEIEGEVWLTANQITILTDASQTNAATWARRNLPEGSFKTCPEGAIPCGHVGRPPLVVSLFGAYLALLGGGTYGDSDRAEHLGERTEAREYAAGVLETVYRDGIYIEGSASLEQIDRQLEALQFARQRRVYLDGAPARSAATKFAKRIKATFDLYRRAA